MSGDGSRPWPLDRRETAILFAVVVALASSVVVLLTGPAVEVLERSPSGRSLDLTIGYDVEHVAREFAAYGPEGRDHYRDFLARDLRFIVIYTLCVMTIIVLSWRRYGSGPPWTLAFPALAAVSDWVEDSLNLANLGSYPDLNERAVDLANGSTITKWFFVALMIAAAVAALVPVVRDVVTRSRVRALDRG